MKSEILNALLFFTLNMNFRMTSSMSIKRWTSPKDCMISTWTPSLKTTIFTRRIRTVTYHWNEDTSNLLLILCLISSRCHDFIRWIQGAQEADRGSYLLTTRWFVIHYKSKPHILVLNVSFLDEELICLNTQKLYIEEKEALTKHIIRAEAELNKLGEKSAQV